MGVLLGACAVVLQTGAFRPATASPGVDAVPAASVVVASGVVGTGGGGVTGPPLGVVPRGVPDVALFTALKDGARGRAGAIPGGHGPRPPGPAPLAVVVDGLSQPGLSAGDNSSANQGTPSDATGASGLAHYVEMVNSKVGVYAKATLAPAAAPVDLDTFVGAPGDDVFDPQVQWDPQAGRWLYVAVRVAQNGNHLAFGWSRTTDPTDLTAAGWCRFSISTGAELDDYPKLGHNDTHIIVASNVFQGNAFRTARVWVVPKPQPGVTACPASVSATSFGTRANPLTTSDGNTAFTIVPANTSDASMNGYLVAADSPYFVASPHQIMVWHVEGPSGSPALVKDGNVEVVTPFAFPANVPQPGTANQLDSSDTRLTQAVAKVDPDAGSPAVWTQHTVAGPGGRAVVRWYEILAGAVPALRQQGAVGDASHFVFNGAVSPAMDGTTAAIFYNVGSGSQLAQVRARTRQGATPLGTFDGEVVLATSAAATQDFSCCRRRVKTDPPPPVQI